MKRFAGILLIFLGVLMLVFGLAGTAFVQDLMPITGSFDSDSHTYYQIVLTGPAPPPYIPLTLIGVGVLAIAAGILVRRRKAP